MSAAAILTISKNGETVKTVPVEGEAMLGRGEGCVIRLEDRAISRQHAVFRPAPGGVQVERKSEFAPMLVNGTDVSAALVKEGDVIAIGPYLVKVGAAKVEAPAPAPVPDTEPVLEAPAELSLEPSLEAASVPTFDSGDIGSLSEASAEPAPVPASIQVGAIQLESPDVGGPSVLLEAAQIELPAYEPTRALEVSSDTAVTSAAEEKLAIKLVFAKGGAAKPEYAIDKDEISIGRGKDCDIVLEDKRSSRKNTTILRKGDKYFIRDLASANGTYVNGIKITEQEISGDDKIRVGDVEFQFKAVSLSYLAREKNFMDLIEPAIAPADPVPPPVSDGPSRPVMINPITGMPQTQAQGQPQPQLQTQSIIPGIAGLGSLKAGFPKSYKELKERFRNDPQFRRQAIMITAVLFGLMMMLEEDPKPQPAKKAATAQKAPAPGASGTPSAQAAFDALSPEQQKQIQSWHDLAFSYYTNKDYDKALFELAKIFALVPDYKQAREIERYANEGKRRNQIAEEEKRKKQEEERVKAQIAQLVDEAGERMRKKQYDQARDRFDRILVLDPDNAKVAEWQKQLQAMEEQKRLAEQQKQIQREVNARAKEILAQASELQKQERFLDSVDVAQQALKVGATDPAVLADTQALIESSLQSVRNKRDPLMEEGKSLESSGDLAAAFKKFEAAAQVDPTFPEAFQGMDRIRGVLHDRAKATYTEAVLAESYSDFATARRKFKETLDVAPSDDVYHERAQRKLNRYFQSEQSE